MDSLKYDDLISEARKMYNLVKSDRSCLDKGLLAGYLHGEFDTSIQRKIHEHVSACERCQIAKLAIESEESEFSLLLKSDPDNALGNILGRRGAKRIASIVDSKKHHLPTKELVSRIKESLIDWVSPIWQPLLVGQVVTAADLQEQTNQFEMDYGEYINISCFWEGQTKDTPPYIRLTWCANLISENNLWVRFIDPDSQLIYIELPLGKDLEGEVRFDQVELGFDPASVKWAVSIVVAKS